MHTYAYIDKSVLHEFQKTEYGDSAICIKDLSQLYEYIHQIDHLVVQSSLAADFACHMDLPQKIGCEKIIIFQDGHFFRLSDQQKLLSMEQRFTDQKDWLNVKRVNHILLQMDFLQKNIIQLGMPDFIQLETTSYCNARCIMCSHYYNHNDGAKHLKSYLIDLLEEEMKTCRVVSLNGIGEPFIHPKIEQLLDKYSSYDVKIATNTNLSVLPDSLLSKINDSFIWIEISCDGADKEVYESIRKGLDFNKFQENLKKLQEFCPKVRKHFNMVVMRQNVHQMPKMVALAAKYGVSMVSFSSLISSMIIDNEQDTMRHYPLVFRYFCQKAQEVANQLQVEIHLPVTLGSPLDWSSVEEEFLFMNTRPHYKTCEQEKKMDKTNCLVDQYKETHSIIEEIVRPTEVRCAGICDWVLNHVYMDLDGNTCMCCRRQLFQTGSVNAQTNLRDVWNGQYYQKLREMFYAGILPESCLGCDMAVSQKLRYLHILDHHRFYQEAEFYKKKKKEFQQLIGDVDNE